MADRTIVITGASDGIGAAAARRLSRQGDHVVVVGRSETKTNAVAVELGAEGFVANYSDLSQVRALAKCLLERYPRIDVLANNAGCMTSPVQRTDDGFEKTFQVNYLAPVLLTTLLLDRLAKSRAMVLNTASGAHKMVGNVSIDDLCGAQRGGPAKNYGQSKLAVVMFSMELHRRYHESGVSVVAYHPGAVASNFGQSSGSRFLIFMERTPVTLLFPSAERGSDPLVWLASGTPGVDWESGSYYDKLKLARAKRQAYDPVLGRRLWERTMSLLES